MNGQHFTPMLEAALQQPSVEQVVKRHLQGIIVAMGARYGVSLILDDRMDRENCGVLSGPGSNPWRTVIAAANNAMQSGVSFPEEDRVALGKSLGLQATAVVTAAEKADDLAGEVDRLRLALMRVASFCDDTGKAIIKRALGGDAVESEVDSLREKIADFMLRLSIPTGHGDTIDDLLVELAGWIGELRTGGLTKPSDRALRGVPPESDED